jgi:hypothetical protein
VVLRLLGVVGAAAHHLAPCSATTTGAAGCDRGAGPGCPRRGGFGTVSVVAGFLQGLVLFLAIPVEWSLPFGGLPVFSTVTALVLWLYLLHVLVLVGYRLTLVLNERVGIA